MDKKAQTKLSGAIGIILLVSFIFLAWSLMIYDFEKGYIDTNISSAKTLEESMIGNRSMVGNETHKGIIQRVDTSERIETSFLKMEEKWDDFGKASGLIDVLGYGFIVFFTTFIELVKLVPSFINLSQMQVRVIGTALSIPVELLAFATIGILIWFIFKGIEIKRQYPV